MDYIDIGPRGRKEGRAVSIFRKGGRKGNIYRDYPIMSGCKHELYRPRGREEGRAVSIVREEGRKGGQFL